MGSRFRLEERFVRELEREVRSLRELMYWGKVLGSKGKKILLQRGGKGKEGGSGAQKSK